ncbi:unnamed protein product [Caenorhabditis brenneri]
MDGSKSHEHFFDVVNVKPGTPEDIIIADIYGVLNQQLLIKTELSRRSLMMQPGKKVLLRYVISSTPTNNTKKIGLNWLRMRENMPRGEKKSMGKDQMSVHLTRPTCTLTQCERISI